ncbi:non-ribosomal peptide synthetase/type I polyketide synthase, partial [Plantactinospora sp. KLBMP9567]|uniref:non-ribosomal peptide synthetase/type I polyketide synthase n=1 Tax=Plantactinospora sp. KLBMP9567 TaxID=3085900 RepID=UPI002980E2CB
MSSTDIAVVGMAIRCPEASDLAEFWANLVQGRECLSVFRPEELEPYDFLPVDPADPNFVPVAGVMAGADRFDAEFFGISRAEAEDLDPQHRLFLELVWHAMEDAGHDLGGHDGNVAVYAGSTSNTYLLSVLPRTGSRLRSYQGLVANEKDYLATRVSYKLGLSGESMTVQSACSTSLVAVHLACQSLLTGQSSVAVAGAVSVQARQKTGYIYHEDAIFSPDGHCRAFDRDARGTVFSNGMGVVVLRPLDDAVRDGDRIYAVIKGSFVNNDANAKVSYTAPSVDAQAAVIAGALDFAGVDADTVDYVETHGTGTSLGDPIEVEALTQAFRRTTARERFCAIGSLKTNIGHLSTAAGVAGLIKTALSVYHGVIPASLNFQHPNPVIDFERSPFYVNTERREWPRTGRPRRAGVSSFGIGGTNAHVVLEQAPPRPARPAGGRTRHLLTLSARTEPALRELAGRHAERLRHEPGVDLADYCFTANTGRRHFAHRLALPAASTAQLRAALERYGRDDTDGLILGAAGQPPAVTFLFTGQTAQYPGMGWALYHGEPAFRAALDECREPLASYLDAPLERYLDPDGGLSAELDHTRVAQPVLFSLGYALARLWQSWGVRPAAVLGHSLGEYVAACVAGVFPAQDGVRLVAERARLMQRVAPDGAMAAVFAPEQEVRSVLVAGGHPVAVAAVNGPRQVVVSGEREAVRELTEALRARDTAVQELPGHCPFHSPLIEPMRDEYAAVLARQRFAEPATAMYSALTGRRIGPGEVPGPEHWLAHLTEPVRYADALAALRPPARVFLEVGPHPTLIGVGRRIDPVDGDEPALWLPSLRQGVDDRDALLDTLGRLYAHGVPVDWTGFDRHERRFRVTVPDYPFQRQRYWIEDHAPTDAGAGEPGEARTASVPGEARTASTPAGLTASTPAGLTASTSAGLTASTSAGRHERIVAHLRAAVARLLRARPEQVDPAIPILQAGVDSIAMIELAQLVGDEYGVTVGMRQIISELNTLEALAAHVDALLPADHHQAAGPGPGEPDTPPVAAGGAAPTAAGGPHRDPAVPQTPQVPDGGTVARLMERQLEVLADVMAQQLRVLAGGDTIPSEPEGAPLTAVDRAADGGLPEAVVQAGPAEPVEAGDLGPYRPFTVRGADADDPARRAALAPFLQSYAARTAGSKRLAATYRPVLADNANRALSDFRMATKEIVYPIALHRSAGSRVWDVDGNEYVDLLMGMGTNLFGHSPAFVTEAIQHQLRLGVHLGAQSDLAGRVAELTCELTGAERVVFCNTGTEAVMTALRLARAHTGRGTVVQFTGAYHGGFDGTLVRPRRLAGGRPAPLAPGVLPHVVDDVVLLDYDRPESLEYLAANGADVAAVLVEPVQSRRPDVQPGEFLRRLRELTERLGAALIFDEIVTGFRCAPGGAQEWFGVRADLCAYGKVLGGGMPIGAVAGRAAYLDAVDGGRWSYGDDSYPRAQTTFFAGTFCKHPLAMAAALATLTELQRQGPELQRDLNERTAGLVERLGDLFAADGVPVSVLRFGSQFRFASGADLQLFFQHLVHNGVHAREGGNCFLSTAHTDADVDAVVAAVAASLRQGRQSGLLFPAARSVPAREPVIPAADEPVPDRIPLTEAQRQLWTLAGLDTDASVAYNQTAVLRVEGVLRLDALRTALAEVLRRHESLRTVFDPAGEHQWVRPVSEVDVEVAVRDVPPDSSLAEVVTAAGRLPFDLVRGPLLRVTVLRERESRHTLLVCAHHIVADGWSMGVLMRELGEAYNAACRDVPVVLPPPTQFRTYRDWLERGAGPGLAAAERYWLDRMAGDLPVLELPTDHPRPAIRGHRGARLAHTLAPELAGALREVAAAHGATPTMLLLTGYVLLLHRLTGARELIVGLPVAGRVDGRWRQMIGMCANLVPIRVRIAPTAPLGDCIAGVRDAVLGAGEHQDYPFPALVRRLGLRLDPARTPLVGTMFNLDRPVEPPALSGLQVEQVTFPTSYVQFDLALNVVETADTFRLELDYATGLFDAATPLRWLDLLGDLLGRLPGGVDRSVQELTAPPPGELAAVFALGTGPVVAGDDRCLPELFDAQAVRTPDRVCVYDGAERLTYRQLRERADALAAHLHGHGVPEDGLVAVLLPRSAAAYVAILGAWKAGAGYLPLDPDHPDGRRADVLADAKPAAVVTLDRLTPLLPAGAGPVVRLDTDWPEIASVGGAAASRPSGPAGPESVAWVIYTSGSTGPAKGVVSTHRAVVNRLRWGWRSHPFGPEDICCHKTALGFVDSVAEMFGPLLSGIPTVVLSAEATRDSRTLVRELADRNVTRIVLVPSLLRVVLDALSAEGRSLPRLRHWVVSGEPLPGGLLDRFHQVLPGASLFNLYGATEVMGDVTAAACPPGAGGGPVPIGRPLDNTRLYVLDEEARPVPIAVTGELYVGGPALARGYLGRPDLTAERFVPDPFGPDEGGRLYRTGDRARLLSDGTLVLVGRADRQLKVRGVRVEPAEVEAALERHPDVSQSAVVAVTGPAGEPVLTGYLTERPGQPGRFAGDGVERLRSFLRTRLPEQLVPTHLVVLADLPRTPTGKVDRAALTARAADARPAPAGAPPRTPTEHALHDIVTSLLGVDRLGVTDDLLDAGGTSLTVMRLAVRLRATFGADLAAGELLAAPTIAGIARLVDGPDRSDRPVPDPAVPRRADQGPAPLSFAQQRLWFLHQYEPESPALNLPFAVRLKGPLRVVALREALVATARRHGALRTVLPVVDGQPVQVVVDTDPPCPTVDLSHIAPGDRWAEALRLAREEACRPFDLAAGPLLRAAVVRIDPTDHLFLLTMHHVVADGWSLGLLVEEVVAGYRQRVDGGPKDTPPELPIQYADFAAWQRERVDEHDADLEYWRTELAGAPAVLELPTDRPRSDRRTSAGATQRFRLERGVVEGLVGVGRGVGATLFMTLLAGFVVVLSRYSGQREVCVGTPVANRSRAELEGLIGFFVNTLVLRVGVSGGVSFR